MANIGEQEIWEDYIRLVEIGDPVAGGVAGPVNLSLQDLANRTKYLKKILDDLSEAITALGNTVGNNKAAALLKNNNLSDVPDKDTARSNLGAAATSHDHDTLLKKNNNLSDVTNKITALGNLGAISCEEKGAVNGVAGLGADGKVPAQQLPDLDYIPTDEKGAASGVADLDSAGKIVRDRIPGATPALVGGARVATDIEAYQLESNEVMMTPARMLGAIKAAMNAAGLAPIYACRAWVRFGVVSTSGSYSRSGYTATMAITGHGLSVGDIVGLTFSNSADESGNYTVVTVANANTFTVTLTTSRTGTGTVTAKRVAIAGSGNVSKVERISKGYYKIYFAKALPHANYAIAGFARDSDNTGDGIVSQYSTDETTAEFMAIRVVWSDNTFIDSTCISVSVCC